MARISKRQKVEQEVTVGYRCDVCRKESDPVDADNEWFMFSHGHGGWGNDSVDSIERFHVCSPECFAARLRLSIKEMQGYERSGAEVADMPLPFARRLLEMLTGAAPIGDA